MVWRNDELTDPPGERPESFGGEHRMQSSVIECDPPRRLAFTWDGDSDVTIDLEPRANEVPLTVVHRHLGSRHRVMLHIAGWHSHLALPVILTRGQLTTPLRTPWISPAAHTHPPPHRSRPPP